MELKSLSQRIKCAKLESWRLRMFLEFLGSSSMCLGVPFIDPRKLGAVGGQQGRLSLPFVGWHTGQPLFMSGAISFLFWRRRPLQIRGSWRTKHCRCTPDSPVPPADRWRGPRVARGLRGRPLRWWPMAHRTVRCTTGQSGEL
jgi:hypothetical protein